VERFRVIIRGIFDPPVSDPSRLGGQVASSKAKLCLQPKPSQRSGARKNTLGRTAVEASPSFGLLRSADYLLLAIIEKAPIAAPTITLIKSIKTGVAACKSGIGAEVNSGTRTVKAYRNITGRIMQRYKRTIPLSCISFLSICLMQLSIVSCLLQTSRNIIMRRACLVAAVILPFAGAVYAEQSTTDRIRLMNAARNVCVPVIAKFADSPDPDTEISYDQGKFKVTRSKQGITVYEDNAKIADIQKFDYANYNTCLEKMVGDSKK
jgi:hypothetical protein